MFASLRGERTVVALTAEHELFAQPEVCFARRNQHVVLVLILRIVVDNFRLSAQLARV
jgi:hypothetical protein